MINGELIDLRVGDYEARIATSGATLVHLRRGGRDLVVPFDAEVSLPGAWQGKTLVPWPNRIDGSRYTYAGVTFDVPCNEPETGAALHGLAGWVDYQVVSDTAPDGSGDDGSGPTDGEVGGDGGAAPSAPLSEVTLALSLQPSYAYPWALEVRVSFVLDAATGLTVTTTATNVGVAAQPAPNVVGAPQIDGLLAPAPYGVSCHPYLTRSVPLDECLLQVPAAQVLDIVPTTMAPAGLRDVEGTTWDWREGRAVGTISTDNAYTALPDHPWQVRLTGGEGGRTVVMSADTGWVQIYTGEHLGRRGVAVEPMTCPPNAFNSGTDLMTLPLGGSHEFVHAIHEED